jgi:hypothetical protein
MDSLVRGDRPGTVGIVGLAGNRPIALDETRGLVERKRCRISSGIIAPVFAGRREARMSRTLLVLGSLLVLASACATSSASSGTAAPLKSQSVSGSAPAATDAKKATAQDDNKMICETERPVGSNIPKRVCRTQAQIDREREAAQKQLLDLSRPGPKDTR